MTPGPGLRKWTEYLSPGPGGMPLALRLSDWLGLAARAPPDTTLLRFLPTAWTSRSALPAVAWQDFKPPCLSSCRRGQCWSRRPNELANDHSCLRSAVLRFSKVAPSNCLRASWHCLPAAPCLLFRLSLFLTSTRRGPTVLCVVSGRTGISRLFSSPREALTCWRTAPHGLFCEA